MGAFEIFDAAADDAKFDGMGAAQRDSPAAVERQSAEGIIERITRR
jgi:hypothetical protein